MPQPQDNTKTRRFLSRTRAQALLDACPLAMALVALLLGFSCSGEPTNASEKTLPSQKPVAFAGQE